MRWLVILFAAVLAGCVSSTAPVGPTGPAVTRAGQADIDRFLAIRARVEPVAEQICRQNTRNMNCDFEIGVSDDPTLPANAWQTLDNGGRPLIIFSQAMLAELRDPHELAFVMSHEAAHHVAAHIPRQTQSAIYGSLLLGSTALLSGADAAAVEAAIDMGGAVGARAFAKEYELEADAIGTRIAHAAGFDPLRGVQVFARTPDPGNQFLGTHPPNAQRVEVVRRVAAGL